MLIIFPIIKNALTGLDISNATSTVTIKNVRFENNIEFDINLYNNSSIREDPLIKGNTFIQTNNSDMKIASIAASECPYIIIDSNFITDPGYFGIISMNNERPFIRKNTITGGNLNIFSTGIFSYNSNGYYNCNEISQFTGQGIQLDNSQPILFNNNIYVNGLGLFLTNNSNPIMEPAYTQNETFVLSGYNWIHHNASQEIYCNNSKYYSSTPFMYKGNNAVEDVIQLADVLIFNQEVSGIAPTIDCPDNYWGGDSPEGRLIPEYSFLYEPYITGQLSYACDFASDPADNTSLPIDYLLFGNVLKNQYEENYNNSINYSHQLLGLSNSNINPVISLNNIFTSTYFSNGNFVDLRNYYLAFASQYSADTLLSTKSKNLAIESKIEEDLLVEAISDYNNIINTSIDEELRFYASIDRSRAIRLLLDSILSHYQGDNLQANTDEMYNDAINYQANVNTSKHSIKLESSREENINSKKKLSDVKSNSENNFAGLKQNVIEKINNFENLDTRGKRNLIIEKNILDMSVNNYVDGIASIRDKLQYLNKGLPEIPQTYKLYQNYPNPFNPSTIISFEIPKAGFVKIKVYDVTGREVKTLVNEFKTAGSYSLDFNGSSFASGVYFYKLDVAEFSDVKRMILIK